MAMGMGQNTPTFRAPPRRVYETLQPKTEIKQSPEAYILHVYLPGYTKERIKITYLSSSQSVKISGQRPILGRNRWSSFDQTYPVPQNCEPEKLQAKFEFGTLILTMPKKKTISQVSPKQELKTNQDKNQPGPAEKPVPEKAQGTIPPQYTRHEVEGSTGPVKGYPAPAEKVVAEVKPQKAQETNPFPPQFTTTKVEEPLGDKKRVAVPPSFVKGPDDLKLKAQKGTTTQEATSSNEKGLRGLIPQKGKEEFEPKPKMALATKTQTDEKPQKGHQEEVEPKPTLTMVTRDTTKEKGHEENRQKTELETINKQLEEKTVTDAAKMERVSKKEVKEDRKPYNMEKATIEEKYTRAREVSHKELAEPSGLKAKEKRKEHMFDNVGSTGIRELAVTTCKVVTRIAEGKLNEEEKHLVVNMGAAVLVIAALGAYVSYRFVSSG